MTHETLHPTTATFADVAFVDWPFAPDQIDEGAPRASGAIVWRSADRTSAAGFWECTAGRFSRTYGWTETAVILSGSALVQTRDAAYPLAPGSLLVLPAGVTASWTIEERVQKAFHLVAGGPLPV